MSRSTLRIALRTLGRHKGFTIVAVASIAIAIALNTVMYSMLDAMLAPQFNVRQPELVYGIRYHGDYQHRLGLDDIERAVAARLEGFQSLTGNRFYIAGARRGANRAENGNRFMRLGAADALVVRPNYFEFLGTPPVEGRTFLPRDIGQSNAVISTRLARKLFPNEPSIGRSFLLDGRGFSVIGVVERSSTFYPLRADVFALADPSGTPVGVTLMRFNRQVQPHSVGDQLEDVAAQLALAAGETPGTTRFQGVAFTSRHTVLRGFHFALIGAVIAVLLVACANLANLQLARGLARTRELALRAAVGASRRQLIAHLLLETGILAAVGLGLGLLLTLWGIHVSRALLPPAIEDYIIEPRTSWATFAAAAAASIVCLFLVGLLPALHISRVDPDTLLKSGHGTGANKQHRRRYGIMVVVQIGFALPVLIGAVVVGRGALRIHGRDWLVKEQYGYDPSQVISASVPIAGTPGRVTRLSMSDVANDLVSRARSITDIVDAAVVFSAGPDGDLVVVDDENGEVREMMAHLWSYRVATPSYLRTMNRPVERGRDFDESEFDGEAVLMNARTATFLWGAHDPIGRAIKFGDNESGERFHRVVGIIGDERDTSVIRRRDPDANFRLSEVVRVMSPRDSFTIAPPVEAPRMLNPWVNWASGVVHVTVYARARGNVELAALRLERALRSSRSGRATPTAAPMLDDLFVSQRRTRHDFVAGMFGTFALIGVLLASVGVYGIVSHSVAERRRELAVRISLGATLRDILHSVLREGNVVVLMGIAAGLLLTKVTVYWLANFFVGEHDGADAVLFAAIAVFLFTVAALAAFIPALRATRIDPVEALRHE